MKSFKFPVYLTTNDALVLHFLFKLNFFNKQGVIPS